MPQNVFQRGATRPFYVAFFRKYRGPINLGKAAEQRVEYLSSRRAAQSFGQLQSFSDRGGGTAKAVPEGEKCSALLIEEGPLSSLWRGQKPGRSLTRSASTRLHAVIARTPTKRSLWGAIHRYGYPRLSCAQISRLQPVETLVDHR